MTVILNSLPSTLPLAETAPVIIVGSGIAGLYTALLLGEHQSVILITKNILSESNTTYAQGGIAAAIGITDSPELHYQDTIMAGAGLCNPDAVLALVYEGPEHVRRLINLNLPFDRTLDGVALTKEAAHSRRRILHADGDATGRIISQTLIQLARENPKIKIYENCFALSLVTRQGKCAGLVALKEGTLKLFLSNAVVLCTGGIGQIYGKTTNPSVATGDGINLAYQAGAVLQDLEFIQFHPTALHLPPAPPFLISEAVRGEGAVLLNQNGERFMPSYHELAELAPRDIVARSIFAEISKENSPCVYLDLSKLTPAAIKQRFPNIYETCLRYGLDITTSPIPVAPAAHYFMGGIQTDLDGRTIIPRLYAAGESAATGVHGANRLASNSLLEGLVFGGRIAKILKKSNLTVSESLDDLEFHYPELITEYKNLSIDYSMLHQLTDQSLGIIRHASGLKKALTKLEIISSAQPDCELDPAYFELQNMLQLAKLSFQAALARTESRGGHFRSDFPEPNPDWRKNITFQKEHS